MRWTLQTCLLSIATLLLFIGCKKDEEGTLKVTFKGSYGTDPLVMFEMHDYADGQRIQFSRSEFFVSDLNLIDNSGNAYPLSEIELIDLSMQNAAAAQTGVVLTFNKIPAGSYDYLEFGFGVASDLNATLPVDYPSSSPLSNTGRYWNAWNSFIFSKTEGNLDTIVDGTDNATLGFAYHTGTNPLFREFRLNTEVDITDDGTTNLTINVDHEKLLGLPDDAIDIQANPQNHNPQDIDHVEKIVNNLLTALSYILE